MGKRKELRLEEKVSLVEKCLSGQLRMREAARRTGGGALNHGELDQPVPLRRGGRHWRRVGTGPSGGTTRM